MLNEAINALFGTFLNDVVINNIHKKLAHNQSVDDIAQGVLVAEWNSRGQAAKLSKQFEGMDKLEVIKKLHAWQRKQLLYKAEPKEKQTVKEVNRILYDANTGNDCKHYATISMALMRALKIPAYFRMVSQNKYDKAPTHIYTVAKINGVSYVVDPCMRNFNSEDSYYYKFNIKPIQPLL